MKPVNGNKPPETPAPQPIVGGDGPATFVDNVAFGMHGGLTRLALCEGHVARVVVMVPTHCAVQMAAQILAAQQEMLRQAMDRGEQGPSSPVPPFVAN